MGRLIIVWGGLVATGLLVSILIEREAYACEVGFAVPTVSPQCNAIQPEGSFVISYSAPVSRTDSVVWTEDTPLSEMLERSRQLLGAGRNIGLRAFRSSGVGKNFLSADDRDRSNAGGDACTVDLVGAAGEPPAAFDSVDTQVTLVEAGSSGRGCSCPEVDELTIVPKNAKADRPEETKYVVAWFGTDVDQTMATRPPDVLFSLSLPDTTIRVTLGIASEHERSGMGFGQLGRYCFSLAWMDTLGRIGERSPATCLDTRDPNDSSVTVDDQGFCVCSAVGKSRRYSGGGVLVPFALVAFARRLTRRRAEASPNNGQS